MWNAWCPHVISLPPSLPLPGRSSGLRQRPAYASPENLVCVCSQRQQCAPACAPRSLSPALLYVPQKCPLREIAVLVGLFVVRLCLVMSVAVTCCPSLQNMALPWTGQNERPTSNTRPSFYGLPYGLPRNQKYKCKQIPGTK